MQETVTEEALQSIQLQELARYLCDLENNVLEMNNHWKALKTEERKVTEHILVLHAGALFFQVGKKYSLLVFGPC